jgi:hypothetical protein
MKQAFLAGFIALSLGASTLAVSQGAEARAVFSFDVGNVAFAYQDGWWDRDHHWHRWRNHHEAAVFQQRYHDRYSDWRHDRDPDHGWHN